MQAPDGVIWSTDRIDGKTLIDFVESQRQKGHQLLVQCLPKTGSSSVAEALKPIGSVHEMDMQSVLNLNSLRPRLNFGQQRQHWLKARLHRLQGRVDVCTSLALVLADLNDRELASHNLKRLILNRSLNPWLHSMVNWSFIHEANPYRRGWTSAYHTFVKSNDEELASIMPAEQNSMQKMIKFWVPIWITYQSYIYKSTTTNPKLILTENLNLGIKVNVSNFERTYEEEFAALIPQLPSLKGKREHDQTCVEKIRHWFIQEQID